MSKPEEIDFNENLRQNYAKACKLLGVKEDPAVTKAINPEPDASAPVVVIATDSALGPAGVRALAAALLARGQGFKVPGYKHVKALRLWRANARDSGAAAVADVLRNGAKDKVEVELVELMDSGITPLGAGALGDSLMLGANASLRTLRLDLNLGLGDEGVAALCRGLRSNRNLRVLTLSHCSLTERAAQSIATDFLASPLCILEALDLTGNALAAEGVYTLASAASRSKTLKELLFCDNQVGGGFLVAKSGMAAAAGGAAGSAGSAAAAAGGAAAAAAAAGGGGGGAEGEADDSESSAQASRAAASVADAIETTAAATRRALLALGEALQLPADVCGLSRVSLEMNALTAEDATVLVPFCGADNTKLEMMKVDATLPPAVFVALWKVPAPAKAKKGASTSSTDPRHARQAPTLTARTTPTSMRRQEEVSPLECCARLQTAPLVACSPPPPACLNLPPI